MDEHGEMRAYAMSTAQAATEQHKEDVNISRAIKNEFDKQYGPTWHCIVGNDFRAFVTHESACAPPRPPARRAAPPPPPAAAHLTPPPGKSFIFFYVGKLAVCLYKS